MDKYRIDVSEHTPKGYLRTIYYVNEEEFLTRVYGKLTGNQQRELNRNGEISFDDEESFDDEFVPIRETLKDATVKAKRICGLYDSVKNEVYIKNMKHE